MNAEGGELDIQVTNVDGALLADPKKGNTAFLIDEADDAFLHSMVKLDRDTVDGLYKFYNRPVLCFSASMSQYWRGVLLQCRLCDSETIH